MEFVVSVMIPKISLNLFFDLHFFPSSLPFLSFFYFFLLFLSLLLLFSNMLNQSIIRKKLQTALFLWQELVNRRISHLQAVEIVIVTLIDHCWDVVTVYFTHDDDSGNYCKACGECVKELLVWDQHQYELWI